jgi:histidyl-tRNA synthetase
MRLKVQKARGMKDYFKEEAEKIKFLREELINLGEKFGFQYIEIPAVEQELLFTASLGEATDVVEKEMYYLAKKEGGQKLVLRPEGTAPTLRLYFENGFLSETQPVKFMYFERMYRRERPQSGRYREHRQFGLEIIGSETPFADFEIIASFAEILKFLKINNFKIKINSIGCLDCREKFKKDLKKYYQKLKRKICDDCKRRLKVNPLRLLDCKNETCLPLKETAPNILNYLCKYCQEHFQKLVEYLERSKTNYEIEETLVRGFDYYNRTVFEIFVPEKGSLALGGGGRYDPLSYFIANQSVPAVGGGLGIERILDLIQLPSKTKKEGTIFVAYVGEEARIKAYEIFLHLLAHNFKVKHALSKTSLSHQLDYANKLGVKYSLILGMLEISQNTIILRDMMTGNQEILSQANLIEELKTKLKEK